MQEDWFLLVENRLTKKQKQIYIRLWEFRMMRGLNAYFWIAKIGRLCLFWSLKYLNFPYWVMILLWKNEEMKKKIWILSLFLLCSFAFILWDRASADCQKIDFWDGKSFCWDVRKTAEGFYRAETSDLRGDLTDLTCTLELANASTVKLDQCRGDFRYDWGNQRFELTANLSDRYFVLINTFNFWNSGNGGYTLQYANFQPEFINVARSRLDRDEYADFTLRVRNTWLDTEYFDGVVRLEVQEWRNGAWRSASSGKYRLDRSEFSFSSYERGEKNLNGILRFYESGEFKLVAKIKWADASAWQTFYVNNDRSRGHISNRYHQDYTEYTANEWRKLRAVYAIWPEVIRKLEDDYPRLRNSSTRRTDSNTFYRNMEKVLDGERYPVFSSWKIFYRSFGDWLNMTIRLR